jgi:glycosyltransferase involved in cell wall biosynthesis
MAACWRALASRPGIDLHVIHLDSLNGKGTPFDAAKLMAGISNEMFHPSRQDLDEYLFNATAAREPDVIVVCGWLFWPYTKLFAAQRFQKAGKVLGMDSPWRGTLAQRFARFRLSQLVSRLDLVVTASDRTAEYARRIGVPEPRLRTGFYGFDHRRFASAAAERPTPWPRQFLFTARYAPEKNVSTLIRAYERYRASVASPWGLTCVGTGPEGSVIKNAAGVVDRGFVQPADLPAIFAQHGAFVLPSRFEPWGVVLGEAAAAGLPVICSSACGAAADVVRPYYNGLIVAAGDADGLMRAMQWVHEHEEQLPEMGKRGQALADAFSAESWAERWHNYLIESCAASRES